MRSFVRLVLVLVLVLDGCDSGVTATARDPSRTSTSTIHWSPSDDPADWPVEPRAYEPAISALRFVVPSGALPPWLDLGVANNNCALCFHEGRLFLAWRTAEVHFPSPLARLLVVSSADLGETWDFELEVAIGADLREPTLLSCGSSLVLHYFEGGKSHIAFEPRHVWQCVREGRARWSAPVAVAEPGEVPWDLKVRGGRAWMTSYLGNHYGAGPSAIDVLFRSAPDGISWAPVDPARPSVYRGGVSEVAFEFDEAGVLWAVGRNEDGDRTGFGTVLASAPAGGLGWSFAARSDPERYDSPRMIRHGRDLYVLARRDVGGPFDKGLTWLPFEAQKAANMGAYSLRPKRTALYKLDRVRRKLAWLLDLPGNGDTAFPAVARMGAHDFLVANYTSPLGNPDRTWIHGQTSAEGTQIYLLTLSFAPR